MGVENKRYDTPEKIQSIFKDGNTVFEAKEKAEIIASLSGLKKEVLDGLKLSTGVSIKAYVENGTGRPQNPEDLALLQLYLKGRGLNVEISGVYDKSTENAINVFRSLFKFPKFKELIYENPTKVYEIVKRAKLYKAMDDIKSIGWINRGMYGKSIERDFNTAKNAILNLNFNFKNPISTHFEGWTSPGSANISMFPVSMTYADFIAKATNETGLVVELFSGEKPKESNDTKNKEYIDNLRTFISAFDKRYVEPHFKSWVRNINLHLNRGDASKAEKEITKMFEKNEINTGGLQLSLMKSKEGLSRWLRLIGNTDEAGNIMASEIFSGNLEGVEESKITDLQNKFKLFKEGKWSVWGNDNLSKLDKTIDKRYEELRKTLIQEPGAIIPSKTDFSQMIEMVTFLEQYIEFHGEEGLGDIAKEFKSMKGVGIFTLSDENAKMAKEMAIIVGSMAVTFGASSLLADVAGGARAVQVARTTAQMKNIQNGQRVRGAGNVVVSSTAGGVARTTETLALGVNQIRSVTIVGEAIIFTTAEGVLHEVFKAPGEKSQDLGDFADKLALNTAMFGMFVGMGKIVGGVSTKLGYNPETATSMQRIMKFSGDVSGDMTAMYALHLVQTGKLEMSPEELAIMAAQVIGFRGGMEMMSKMYPNGKLTQTMEQKIAENRARVSESKAKKETTKMWEAKGTERKYLEENGIMVSGGERISTGVASKEVLEINGKLSDFARIKKAEHLLGRTFSQAEKDVLLKAHNYPQGNNIAKGKALREGGFTRNEAEILMDKGIAGRATQAGYGELTDAKLRELSGRTESVQGKTSEVRSNGLNTSTERVLVQQQLRNLLQIHVKKPGDTLNLGEKLGSQYDGYIITKLGGKGNNYELTLPDGTKRNFTGNENFRRELQAHLAGRETINLPMRIENLSLAKIPEGGLQLVKGRTYQLTEMLPNSNFPIGTKISGDLIVLPNGVIKGTGLIELPNGIKVRGNFSELTFVDGKVNGFLELINGNVVISGEIRSGMLFQGIVKENGVVISRYENGKVIEGREIYQNNLLRSLSREQSKDTVLEGEFIPRETGNSIVANGNRRESVTIEGEAIKVESVKPEGGISNVADELAGISRLGANARNKGKELDVIINERIAKRHMSPDEINSIVSDLIKSPSNKIEINQSKIRDIEIALRSGEYETAYKLAKELKLGDEIYNKILGYENGTVSRLTTLEQTELKNKIRQRLIKDIQDGKLGKQEEGFVRYLEKEGAIIKEIKISKDINTQTQAKSFLQENWKKLALGAGALALLIGGALYLASMDDEGNVQVDPVNPGNGETPLESVEQTAGAEQSSTESVPAQPVVPAEQTTQAPTAEQAIKAEQSSTESVPAQPVVPAEQTIQAPTEPTPTTESVTENPTYTEEDYNKLKAFIENRSGFTKDSLADKIISSSDVLNGYKHFGYNQDGTLYLKQEKSPYNELMIKFDLDKNSNNITYSISKETGRDIMDNPQYESKGKGKVKLSINGGKVDKVELLK